MPILPEEKGILELKYKSPRFIALDDDTLRLTAKALILKIHVIVGWVVPEAEMFNILTEQFKKLLTERYANYNSDEVEYAFRNIGINIKDWGKAMNLSLIDEVMFPYMQQRLELSRIEEQKMKDNLIEWKEDLSEKAMLEWWKETEVLVKTTKYRIDLIPIPLYKWMDEQGGINKTIEEKHDYIKQALTCMEYQLKERYEKNMCEENRVALSKFTDMKLTGIFTGPEVIRLKNLAKQIVVFDMMKSNQ